MGLEILIEGNIGVGKSYTSKKISELLGFRLFSEGADENPKFKLFLELFYADPKKHGFALQFWLMAMRYEQHRAATEHIWKTGQACVFDRSIYGDLAFALANERAGNLAAEELECYMKMRSVMERGLLVPQLTIYLDARPAVCLERIRARRRACEAGISLEYLEKLEVAYKVVLSDLAAKGSKVCIFDWNSFQPLDRLYDLIRKYIQHYSWTGYDSISGPPPVMQTPNSTLYLEKPEGEIDVLPR
jgi:deoxyadenosine/deoxycytidine kinase